MQIPAFSVTLLDACTALGILIPVALLLFFQKKTGAPLRIYFIGCASFALFALGLEPILHQLILASPAGASIQGNIILYGLYGGLAAGLFEETGRLVVMKWLKRKYNTPGTALMYGAGHAGFEVLVILGVTMGQYAIFANTINAGHIETILSELGEEAAAAILPTLENLALFDSASACLAIAERISAIILQISLSVFVWQAAGKSGKIGYYFLAIALHAFADASAVMLSGTGISAAIIEVYIFLVAAAIALAAWKLPKE